MTRALASLGLMALAAALGGCQSTVKGSWACAVDRGGVCASITDIDHMPARGGPRTQGASIAADPVVDGAIPAKLWGEGGWTAGPLAGAPVRQSDQVMKVAVAPWVDQAGDYHTGAEVYAVMRRADWYAPRSSLTQRIELQVRRNAPVKTREDGAASAFAPDAGPTRVAGEEAAPATARPSGQARVASNAAPALMGAPVPALSTDH